MKQEITVLFITFLSVGATYLITSYLFEKII